MRKQHDENVSFEKQSNTASEFTNIESTVYTPASKRRTVATADVAHGRKQMETSEVNLFCKLLAAKMICFPQETREGVMHQIDEFIYLLHILLKKCRENTTTTPLSQTSRSFTSPITITVLSPFPLRSFQSQFSFGSYVETQPDYSRYIDNSDSQADGSTTQNNVQIISNELIGKAFVMAHKNCTKLEN